MPRPLYVARPLLPDINDFEAVLKGIWNSRIVTNGGPLHNKLEAELQKYLDVPTAMLFNNGTMGLLVALKMFDFPKESEIITTPLTFAATAHAIKWNGFKPVFADVDPNTLTLDPASVEKAITAKTAAILAVHVYGTVCDVDKLQEIATKYNLKLIYDAAHVFGTKINGQAIGKFGDASVFSFHATKLFNTIEGGLIATPHKSYQQTIYNLRNFGIKNEEEVVSIGLNGKMNELQAAIGLLNLPLVEKERSIRRSLRQEYCSRLEGIKGITLPPCQKGVFNSEQYFPLVIDEEVFGRSRDEIYDALKKKQIFTRKYFHPICTDFLPYKGYGIVTARDHPYANVVKHRVLCLPFHSAVEQDDITDICNEFLK